MNDERLTRTTWVVLVSLLTIAVSLLPGAAGAVGLGIFGDGSDGDVTISADTTLTRDMYFNKLDVPAGVHLDTGGFRVFCKTKCTIDGTIRNNGGNASGSGGHGAPSGTVGGGANGGEDGQPGTSIADAAGGNGGGNGPPGGTAIPPAANHGGVDALRALPYAVTGTLAGTGGATLINGGAGGSGGPPSTDGGGGGGGVVIVAAKAFSGTGQIQANGGLGGLGGGGGGGVVVTVSRGNLGRIVVTADGGAGGGGHGAPGRVYHLSD